MERCGFFNAKLVDGSYDRTYNAKDYNDQLGAVISTGVRRSGDDDLKVTANDNMTYSVGVGRAWIQGAWYHNDATYQGTIPNANVTLPRIDRVILRYNGADDVRSVNLAYLTGSASSNPSAPALTRTSDIYEICLAEIYVGANASSILQANITDKRADKDVCGWVTTPVGYDDYFESMDNTMLEHLDGIDSEWKSMKDKFASTTLFKKYEEKVTLNVATNRVNISIPQYSETGVDILEVFVNGQYVFEGEDYTVDGRIVTFTLEKPVGTVVSFSVYKSIDGTGLGGVSDEITELQNKIDNFGDLSEYNYICTGVDDNIKISQICDNFFTDGADNGQQLKLNIYGQLDAVTPMLGEGSTSNRFKWFSVSPTGDTTKRIILDFSNCDRIQIPISAGSYNIVFFGKNMTIINANVYCQQKGANSAINAFSSTNGDIKCYKSKFVFDVYHASMIAENGLFEDCYGEVTVESGEAYCFNTNASGLLTIRGGEYRAYANGANSYGVRQTASGAVVICYGVNFSQVAKGSYTQNNAIGATAGTAIVRDTITPLTVTAGTVSSTVVANKPRG